MNLQPFVSVIIPTYNREDVLCNTLSFLFSQKYPTFEIIVVDQSRRHLPETEKFIQEHQSKMQYHRIEKVGTSHAKNYGALRAKGELLVFFDDDIVPHDDYLIQRHVDNYQDAKVGGVGGRVIVKDNSMSNNPKHIAYVSKAGIFYDNFSLTTKGVIDTVHGCNMSFRKALFEEVGGFDEHFTGNAFREESDLSFRVRKKGYTLVFEPEAEVLHVRCFSGGTRSFEDKITWYFHLFHNETLFFLKNMPKQYFPLFLLGKWRPILACMFWYGKGRPKALLTPLNGIISGIRHYRLGRRRGLYD
ncbi:MAG: glycosyltransferase family 2 protein [bacterium]